MNGSDWFAIKFIFFYYISDWNSGLEANIFLFYNEQWTLIDVYLFPIGILVFENCLFISI